MEKEKISKTEELENWKARLYELSSEVAKQIKWAEQPAVFATKNPNCPEELNEVADHLIDLQNKFGEYQRNQINSKDVEAIKYYTKKSGLKFGEVIDFIVNDNRYITKDAIEARGIMRFVVEIQSVYDKYYEKFGVFPINAMSAESKRGCRNFKNDVSLKEKVEAIIDVYFSDLKGINIAEKDFSVLSQSRFELSDDDIKNLKEYFVAHSEDGKIDNCFSEENRESFLKTCKLLDKARISLDEFLKTYTNLTYTKCFSGDAVRIVRQMILSYKGKHGTTRRITDNDPYLRHKIEIAQKVTGCYNMVDLLKVLDIAGDNLGEGRKNLTISEISARHNSLLKTLGNLYPNHVIGKSFIHQHPDLYEELKLVSSRFDKNLNIDQYLNQFGFTRESAHEKSNDTIIYVSERDLYSYGFGELTKERLDECNLKHLEPQKYFGEYNKLIFCEYDGSGSGKNTPKVQE